MSKKAKKNISGIAMRITALVLAGLMLAGAVTSLIFYVLL